MAGEIAPVILPLGYDTDGDLSSLRDQSQGHKLLSVQFLVTLEKGKGEALQGCHMGHKALHCKGFIHGYPIRLQLQNDLLWRLFNTKGQGSMTKGYPPLQEGYCYP